jgi:pimeloyl-ACP methyl ester carboxylesterase
VFFYLCGEATCQPTSLGQAIAAHAKTAKAYLVSLEHRYYGDSQPFASLTTENLKYLSTDFALKDAAAFEQYMQKKRGLTGPWIVVGGSYPGSLSAFYRLKYPDLVVGSLASSGPVQAKANFEEYDQHVATVAGADCAATMRKVTAQVEAALAHPADLADLKKKFQAEALVDDDDFVYFVADMGAMAIQYGYRDHFCELISGNSPIDGWAQFTKEIYVSWGMDALSDSPQGAVSLDPQDYKSAFGLRQWFYQSCTEYGYWQTAFHDAAVSVRSQRTNMDYFNKVCKRLFGLTAPVDTSHVNETLYKPLLAAPASKILFTNGSDDPWSRLSISKENGNDVNPKHSYYTIAKSAHCDDLRTPKSSDSAELEHARQLFDDLVATWIKRP